jgi:hypothetical protein
VIGTRLLIGLCAATLPSAGLLTCQPGSDVAHAEPPFPLCTTENSCYINGREYISNQVNNPAFPMRLISTIKSANDYCMSGALEIATAYGPAAHTQSFLKGCDEALVSFWRSQGYVPPRE